MIPDSTTLTLPVMLPSVRSNEVTDTVPCGPFHWVYLPRTFPASLNAFVFCIPAGRETGKTALWNEFNLDDWFGIPLPLPLPIPPLENCPEDRSWLGLNFHTRIDLLVTIKVTSVPP